MANIKKLKKIDGQIFKVDQKLAPYIEWLISESPIPKTAKLFFMYITSSNFIKNSIFDCAESEDVYSVKILFRALLEHYLRFQFLFIEYVITKDDLTSSEYYTVLDISEHINYIKSIQTARSLQNMEEISFSSMWDAMVAEFPQYSGYDRFKIEEAAKKFSIKNIIKYIEKHIKVSESNITLPDIILEYSELSSFVHGGVYAFENLQSLTDKSKRNNELERVVSLSLQVATAIKLFSLMVFLKYEKEITPIYIDMASLIKMI